MWIPRALCSKPGATAAEAFPGFFRTCPRQFASRGNLPRSGLRWAKGNRVARTKSLASRPLRKLYNLIEAAAQTGATVLVTGESGTG